MRNLFTCIILMLSCLLSGCYAVDTLSNGFKHGEAVSKAMLDATGEKPVVRFNAQNGTLLNVEVMFKKPPQKLSLAQIRALVKTAVASEFKQKPEVLIVSFAFKTSAIPD